MSHVTVGTDGESVPFRFDLARLFYVIAASSSAALVAIPVGLFAKELRSSHTSFSS
jgi:hypothetical protein